MIPGRKKTADVTGPGKILTNEVSRKGGRDWSRLLGQAHRSIKRSTTSALSSEVLETRNTFSLYTFLALQLDVLLHPGPCPSRVLFP